MFATGAVFPVLADDHWSPPKDAAKVTYEDFARWPKKKHNVLVNGRIEHVVYNGNNVSFTLGIASSREMNISLGHYSVIYWRQPDDFPNLLEGDYVDVWGEFLEMKKYDISRLTPDVYGEPVAVIHAQQVKFDPELAHQPLFNEPTVKPAPKQDPINGKRRGGPWRIFPERRGRC